MDDLPAAQAAKRKGRRGASANREKGKEKGKEAGKKKTGKETGKERTGKEMGKEKGNEKTGKEKDKGWERATLREPLDNEEEGQFLGYRFIDPPPGQRERYPVDERDEYLPEVALRFAPNGFPMDVDEEMPGINMHENAIEPPANRSAIPPFDFYGMHPQDVRHAEHVGSRNGPRNGPLPSTQGMGGSRQVNNIQAYARSYVGSRSGPSLQVQAAPRTTDGRAGHLALGAVPMQRNQASNQHYETGRSLELGRLLQEEQEAPIQYYRQREWRDGMAGPSNEVFIDQRDVVRQRREEPVQRQHKDAKKQQRHYRD